MTSELNRRNFMKKSLAPFSKAASILATISSSSVLVNLCLSLVSASFSNIFFLLKGERETLQTLVLIFYKTYFELINNRNFYIVRRQYYFNILF